MQNFEADIIRSMDKLEKIGKEGVLEEIKNKGADEWQLLNIKAYIEDSEYIIKEQRAKRMTFSEAVVWFANRRKEWFIKSLQNRKDPV